MASDKIEMVSREEASEQVRKVCRRLGLLHFAFSSAAMAALGQEKGEQLVLEAIKNYARMVGEEVKKKVAARGLANVPANYQEDLPLYGMHKGAEKVTVNGESRTRMYGCVMAQVWHELDADELGRLYCYVDIAKYMAFNPDFKQVHIGTVTDGCEHCEFVIRPTTEQERKDFATPNKDWRYLDTS
jgi:hypothetical protein